ncbi:MAG: hypothetical protein H6841_02985 [Planctomycetes bacterium]|nr:hypothetical protein [Planctomycetota bacterium]
MKSIAAFVTGAVDVPNAGAEMIAEVGRGLSKGGFKVLKEQPDERGGALMCRKGKTTFAVSIISGRTQQNQQQWLVRTGEMRGCFSVGRTDPARLEPLLLALAELLPRIPRAESVRWFDDIDSAVNRMESGRAAPNES